MEHEFQLLVALIGILLIAKIAADLSHRIGQPAVFGELLAGLILGPTVLNVPGLSPFSQHRPEVLARVLRDIAQLGVILLMFLAGLETDMAMMRRVGRTAFWSATGGVILPIVAGTLVSRFFSYSWPVSIFVGTVLTATSVSISAQTLMELGHLKSREGTCIIGAAFIDDILGLIVLSLVIAFEASHHGFDPLGMTALLVRIALFLMVGIWLGGRFLPGLARRVSALHASEILLTFALAICFLYAWAAEQVGGIAAISGAYLAGALFARTGFREELLNKTHILTYAFFVPVFFISIGLYTNARPVFGSGPLFTFALIILIAAILTKAVGCAIGARLTGFGNMESLRVGIGMISRGEVALITASIGLADRLIDQDIFAVMILMTLITTLATPVLLRFTFPRSAPKSQPISELPTGGS